MRSFSASFTAFLIIVLFPACGFTEELTVVAVGDIYLGGRVEPFIKELGPDYPFGPTRDILGVGDVVVGNLEGPLTVSDEVFVEKAFVLKASPDIAAALADAGFNVLTLANNHIMDYGYRGLADTLDALEGHKLGHAGAGTSLDEARRPAVLETKGVKVSVLAYSNTLPKVFYAGSDSPGTARGLVKYVKEDVRRAAHKADIVVVSFHWGEERAPFPKDYQRVLAHAAIDSGAKLVIGHHPHVFQGIERYKDGLIFYSLGNFVFGSYSLYDAQGMIVKVVFHQRAASADKGYFISSAEIVPIDVENKTVKFRPKPVHGPVLTKVISEIEALSVPFNVTLRSIDRGGEIILPPPPYNK